MVRQPPAPGTCFETFDGRSVGPAPVCWEKRRPGVTWLQRRRGTAVRLPVPAAKSRLKFPFQNCPESRTYLRREAGASALGERKNSSARPPPAAARSGSLCRFCSAPQGSLRILRGKRRSRPDLTVVLSGLGRDSDPFTLY